MRQRRFVSLTEEDGHALLETTDGLERFTLPVDVALRDAVRADLPRLTPTATTPASEPAAAPAAPAAPATAAPATVAPATAAPATAAPATAEAIGPREI